MVNYVCLITYKEKCKCYNCGEEGHKSYECNKKKVKISRIDRLEIDSDLESVTSIKSEDFYEELYEEYSTSSEESKRVKKYKKKKIIQFEF